MPELQHGAVLPWQELEKGPESVEVLAQVGRQLEEHRAAMLAEGLDDAVEVVELLADLGESLLVGDAPGGLEGEPEAGGHPTRPALEDRGPGHAVEGVVDLDRGQPLRVVVEHARGGQVLGVEAALPALVRKTARSGAKPHDGNAIRVRRPEVLPARSSSRSSRRRWGRPPGAHAESDRAPSGASTSSAKRESPSRRACSERSLP